MINIIKQVFQRSTIVFINQLSLLITIPFVSNVFTPNTFGLFSQAIIFIQVAWIISEWGISNYTILIFPKKKADQHILFLEISSLIIFILFFINLFLFLIIKILNIGIDNNFFIILCLSFIFGGLNPLWFFQAQLRPNIIIWPTFVSRILFVILVFILVRDDSDIYIYFLLNGLIFIFIFIFSIVFLYREGLRFSFFKMTKIFVHLKNSFNFFLSTVIGHQFTTFWMFFFSIKSSPSLIAIYAIGDHFLRAINTFTNILSNVVWANKEKIKNMKNELFYFSLLTLMIAIFLWLLLPIIIPLFFSEFYLDSINVCKALLIIWIIHGITKICMYPLFGKIKSVDWVNKINFFFGLAHIFAMIFWYLFSSSLWLMIYVMIFIVFIQLIFFFLSLKKINK